MRKVKMKLSKKVLSTLAISVILIGTTGAASASEAPRKPGTFQKTNSNVSSNKVASWYGGYFHGRRAADGSFFNENGYTTASMTHKMGTRLQVTNPANGKSVIVKVTDRGAFNKYGRTLDLSKGAFAAIAPLGQGTCKVQIKVLGK